MSKVERLAEAVRVRAIEARKAVSEVGDGFVAGVTAPRGEIRDRTRAAYHHAKTRHANEAVMKLVTKRLREEIAARSAEGGDHVQPDAPARDALTTWHEYLAMANSLLVGSDQAVASLKGLGRQIGLLRKYEFVFETLVGPSVLASFAVIEVKAIELGRATESFGGKVRQLQATPSAAIEGDEAVARDVLARFQEAIGKQREALERASIAMTEAATSVDATVTDKAIEAIVSSETTPIGVVAGLADTLSSIALDFGSEVKEPEVVAAVSAVQSFKPIATHIIRACFTAVKKKAFRDAKGTANLFSDPGFQPLTFARMLIDNQKRLVQEVLDGLSFVTSWAPVFATLVKPIVVTVATDLLEARYLRAETALKKKNAAALTLEDVEEVVFGASGDTAEDYVKMVEGAVSRTVDIAKNVLHEAITSGVSGVSGGGVNAVRVLLGFLDPLIARLFALLPLAPAQAVTSEQLSGSLEDIFASSAMGGEQERAAGGELPEYVVPDRTKEGFEIVGLLSREKEQEEGRDFLWARVRGEEGPERGRLFVGDWDFVAVGEEEVPDDVRELPDTTNKGVEITEFKGTRDVDGTPLPFCRVRNVWGTIDADRAFTPREPVIGGDPAPWRNRVVNLSGYVDEDGRDVPGTWYVPFPEWSHSYLFVPAGDTAGEWVHGTTNTKGGPGYSGGLYALEAKLKDRVAIGVRPDSWTEDFG